MKQRECLKLAHRILINVGQAKYKKLAHPKLKAKYIKLDKQYIMEQRKSIRLAHPKLIIVRQARLKVRVACPAVHIICRPS